MIAHPAAAGSASRWRAAGRLLLLVAGIGLTTWGVCLVAFATTMRNTRLGIPIAFWGVLLGYAAIRGTSFRGAGLRTGVGPVAADEPAASAELEVRASAELVRERDQSARREYELQLELMLRRELEDGLREELAGLRRDVAELRGDVLDAVDGRLRLERVEITRIVGSNLAAMEDDVRVLPPAGGPGAAVTISPPVRGETPVFSEMAVLSGLSGPSAPPTRGEPPIHTVPAASRTAAPPLVEPDPEPASNPAADAAADPAAGVDQAPWRLPEPIVRPDPGPAVRTWDGAPRSGSAAPFSSAAAPASPVASAVAPPYVAPGPAPAPSSPDPFAGLPRLSAFQLPDLPRGATAPAASVTQPVVEPVEVRAESESEPVTDRVEVRASTGPEANHDSVEIRASTGPEAITEPVAGSAASGSQPDEESIAVGAPSGYVGRRRHASEEVDEAPSRGRHGADPALGPSTHRR